jgi:hypothetical protein
VPRLDHVKRHRPAHVAQSNKSNSHDLSPRMMNSDEPQLRNVATSGVNARHAGTPRWELPSDVVRVQIR